MSSVFLLLSSINLNCFSYRLSFQYRFLNSILDKQKHLTAKLQIAVFIFHKNTYQTGTIVLKVHKIEIFFGFDFEICIISLLVMSKY